MDHQARNVRPVNAPAPGIFRCEHGWLYRASWLQMSAEVLVSHDGTSMSWFTTGGPDEHDIASLITGAMASAAATAAGAQVFHGALLRVREYNLAILGDTGAGKSTTTWALVNAGADLLSDDAFRVVNGPDGEVRACTAGRALRLDDPALTRWGVCPDTLPNVHLADTRRLLTCEQSGADTSAEPATLRGVPLHGVLILRRGERTTRRHTIAPLSPSELFLELPKNMHPAWMHRKPSAAAFRAQTSLADKVPAWELIAPGTLAALRSDAARMFTRLANVVAQRDQCHTEDER